MDSNSIYQAVLERYVGKQPNIIKAENELNKLRMMIVERQFSILNRKTKGDVTAEEINESKENKNIEKYLRDTFDVKEMRIVWLYTSIPNAATPVKSFPMMDKNYGVNSKGVDYNKKLIVTVFVHTGLFTHVNMTADEVMAIILHEIGHNFYQSIFHTLTRVNPYTLIAPTLINPDVPVTQGMMNVLSAGLYDFMDLGAIFKAVYQMKENVIDKLGLRKLYMGFNELAVLIGSLTPSSVRTLIGLLKGRLYIPLERIDPFDIALTYSVEKHADSFAVDYGYGKSLASGLNKMDQRVDSFKHNIPVISWMYDFEALVNDIFFQTFSGYPTIHNRQQSVIKRLKTSLNDPNIPKDIKKELEKDIKEFEEYYENYMSISNDENKKRIFTWMYRRGIVDGVFGGNVDLREFFYKFDKTHAKKDTWEVAKELQKK